VIEAETRDHLIAASNFLFGVANFLTLTLPEPWRLGRGISPPEVNSYTRRGDLLWVTSGRTSHIVFDEDRKIGLELLVSISKGKRGEFKPRIGVVSAQGVTHAGGHEAAYVLGETKVGLFKKRTIKILQLSFYCDKTERTITLTLTGDCAGDDLIQILEVIPRLECH